MRPGDPRLRLLAAVAAIACVAQLRSLAVSAGVFLIALLAAWRIPSGTRLSRRLLHVEGFVLLLFVTLPFTVAGEALFTLGPLTASREGFWRAALLAAKVSSSVLILTVLVGNLEPARLGGALRGLGVPESIARLFVTTFRYTSLIRDEVQRLLDAMRARGFRPGSNRHTWRSYGYLIGMLLVRALDRARRIEEAMLCRGYAGHYPYRAQPAPPWRDWAGFGLISCLGVVALALDRL